MIKPDRIIKDFALLGNKFDLALKGTDQEGLDKIETYNLLSKAIEQSYYNNPWFIPRFVRHSFSAWAQALKKDKIESWISKYKWEKYSLKKPVNVAIIMAGNIPMVGLHDLLCVLASGNRALVKLSNSDNLLIPAVLKVLCHINPEYDRLFNFAEGPLMSFDAVIATGSNNSSRYFDYYFGKYPHIIRKNRNGIAVLDGNENEEELKKLADDIFIYFGLGCRNVSKLYIPQEYDIEGIFQHLSHYSFMSDLHKYRNNYDYQKSILLINRVPHSDNGFLLVKPDPSFISPISVVHTETYQSIGSLARQLSLDKDHIQCVVSGSRDLESAINPGRSQFPELWDYADGVDTMNFLANL